MYVHNDPVNWVDPEGLINLGKIVTGSLITGGGMIIMETGVLIVATSWGHPLSFPEFAFGIGIIQIGKEIYMLGYEGINEGWL